MIQIDKGVPVPKRKEGPGRPETRPWSGMTPGDSFFEATDKKAIPIPRKHRQRAKWNTRTVIENGERGIRVWRIE